MDLLTEFYILWDSYSDRVRRARRNVTLESSEVQHQYMAMMDDVLGSFKDEAKQWYMGLSIEDQFSIVERSLIDDIMYVHTWNYWSEEQLSYFRLMS